MTGYSGPVDGYYAAWASLVRQASVLDDLAERATAAQAELRAAFDRDRHALGNDQYGAELAKKLPAMESDIFAAISAHIAELEHTAGGLRANARNYEAAEQPSSAR
ncbi:MAG: hypothetical protein HOY71_52205 [Nonomuraea sp.]|nr:hypothetical protein [Nonomuraea sp.]